MTLKNLLIIDYGVGNHTSIVNALKFLGYNFFVSSEKESIQKADAYILTGVGAFAEAMDNIERLQIKEPLKNEILIDKKPLLGICLGMQILFTDSEENGYHKGLNLLEGNVIKIPKNNKIRIPHVGWNDIKIKIKDPLFKKNYNNSNFYFDHNFYVLCDEKYISATVDYGIELTAAIQKDNIFGVQFHPEKSQNIGLKMLRSFMDFIEQC